MKIKIESRYGRVKDKNAIKWPFPFRRISKNGKNGLLGIETRSVVGLKCADKFSTQFVNKLCLSQPNHSHRQVHLNPYEVKLPKVLEIVSTVFEEADG